MSVVQSKDLSRKELVEMIAKLRGFVSLFRDETCIRELALMQDEATELLEETLFNMSDADCWYKGQENDD